MGELVASGQFKQVIRLDAPSVVEYFATGHAKQAVATVAAVVIEYFPASQLVHVAVPAVVL